jgi:hypothetical protein
MNRALGLDLGQTGHWGWTWDEQGIGTGPGMNRALVVTPTHGSYATAPGTNRALGVPQTHVRYTGPRMNWTWDEQGIGSTSDTHEVHWT